MFLFRNCNLLDPASGTLRPGTDILVEGDRFKEVSDRPIKSGAATVVDVGGRTVMPGLIDAHIHVYLSEVNLQLLDAIPLTLMAGRAATLMRAMIDRGFTTVRDTGGGGLGVPGRGGGGPLLRAPPLLPPPGGNPTRRPPGVSHPPHG